MEKDTFTLCEAPKFAPDPKSQVQGEQLSIVPYSLFTGVFMGLSAVLFLTKSNDICP